MYKVVKILILAILSINIGQSQMIGKCGTSSNDNLFIKDRMLKNRLNISSIIHSTNVIRYIPLTYFLSAKDDGSGRIHYINVLNNICALNEIFKDQDIIFYLKGNGSGMIDVNNSIIYDEALTTSGASEIQKIQNNNKNAINVFVTDVLNATNLNTLSYYSIPGDYIVADEIMISSDATRLTHELGHYFSLPHTYLGWGEDIYDCTIPTPTEHLLGNKKVLVEYVDRTKTLANGQLHCHEAADGFCDTQADYGFSILTPSSCTWSSNCAKDPDGNQNIDPDELNLMSEFYNCIITFSQEQKMAIISDYLSSNRDYLKSPAHIPFSAVINPPKNPRIISNGFNSITFKWDPAANATHYILEFAEVTLGNTSTYQNYILTRTDTTFTNMKKGTKYAWKVTAYNPTNPCPMSTVNLNFRTSDFGVATQDLNNIYSKIQIYNTGNGTYNLEINSTESTNMQFELSSTQGQLMHSEKLNLISGKNIFSRNINYSGTFTYHIFNESSSYFGKFIVL